MVTVTEITGFAFHWNIGRIIFEQVILPPKVMRIRLGLLYSFSVGHYVARPTSFLYDPTRRAWRHRKTTFGRELSESSTEKEIQLGRENAQAAD